MFPYNEVEMKSRGFSYRKGNEENCIYKPNFSPFLKVSHGELTSILDYFK